LARQVNAFSIEDVRKMFSCLVLAGHEEHLDMVDSFQCQHDYWGITIRPGKLSMNREAVVNPVEQLFRGALPWSYKSAFMARCFPLFLSGKVIVDDIIPGYLRNENVDALMAVLKRHHFQQDWTDILGLGKAMEANKEYVTRADAKRFRDGIGSPVHLKLSAFPTKEKKGKKVKVDE